MIRFRQKVYAAPALLGGLFANGGGMMAATTGVSLVAGHVQSKSAEKQNEELADQQRRDAAKTRAALDRLAKSDVSQEKKTEAASLFSQRNYALPAGVTSVISKAKGTKLGGLANDLYNHYKPGMKSAVKMGAGFAAVNYLGNRVAATMKNHDEGRDDKNVNFLKKAAIGAATVGGGIYAAKKGFFMPKSKFGAATKDFMSSTGKGGKFLKTTGKVLNPIQRHEDGSFDKMGTGMNGLFMAMPVVGYMAQKGSKNGVANNTEQQPEDNGQKEYSIGGFIRSIPGALKGHAQKIGQTTKQIRNQSIGRTVTGGFNKFANTFGMMGTKGGTTAVEGRLKDLKNNATSEYTRKLADYGLRHKNVANVAAGVATLGVGSAAMGIGDKIINKPMKMVDKDAYQMEEQENGAV